MVDKQANIWDTFFMSQSMAVCFDQFWFSCHGAWPILQPIRFSTPGQILSRSSKLQHVKNYESCPTKVSCMSRLSRLSRLSVLNAALIALNDESWMTQSVCPICGYIAARAARKWSNYTQMLLGKYFGTSGARSDRIRIQYCAELALFCQFQEHSWTGHQPLKGVKAICWFSGALVAIVIDLLRSTLNNTISAGPDYTTSAELCIWPFRRGFMTTISPWASQNLWPLGPWMAEITLKPVFLHDCHNYHDPSKISMTFWTFPSLQSLNTLKALKTYMTFKTLVTRPIDNVLCKGSINNPCKSY